MGIESRIAGRPKHFYSIWKKMHEGGREFDEIYDLTAVRVLTNACATATGRSGVIHSLWKPVPGRFKDFIAMPKPNMYQSLHTTVIGPKGDRVEIQIRTHEMHRIAEEGIAAHWVYKEKKSDRDKFDDAVRLAAAAAGVAEGPEGPARSSWRPSRSTSSPTRSSSSRRRAT